MADYDGDGRADLLSGSTCCQDPACFYLFRRRPDGTFGPRETIALDYPPGLGPWELPVNGLKSRVAVADWNGDGHPDLLVTGYGIAPPAVAYGPLAGKGTVTVRRLWPKGEEPIRYLSANPVLADWDGDGRADLVAGTRVKGGVTDVNGAPGVYWWRNVGTKQEPRLGPPELLIPESGTARATGVAVADWDADGKLDLIVGREERNGRDQNWSTKHHKVWVYLRQ